MLLLCALVFYDTTPLLIPAHIRKNPPPHTHTHTHSLSDLTYSQKESLHGWVEKYKYYKCYPVVGRLVTPPQDLKLTAKELAPCNGAQATPEGYAAPPIYVAVKGTVFDMSFGGRGFYGPGGAYHFLAGRDGSRPLAKVCVFVCLLWCVCAW